MAASSYRRGLCLALLTLVPALAGIFLTPTVAAAGQPITQGSGPWLNTTSTNVATDPAVKSLNGVVMNGTATFRNNLTSNITRAFPLHLEAKYTTDLTTSLAATARLIFTTNDSVPYNTAGWNQTLMLTGQPASPTGLPDHQTYRGDFAVSDLRGAPRLRFVIQLDICPSTQGICTPNAAHTLYCDVGNPGTLKNPPATGILSGACPGRDTKDVSNQPPLNFGRGAYLDGGVLRPKVVFQTIGPNDVGGANHAFVTNDTKAGFKVFLSTNGTGFGSVLDASSFVISVRNATDIASGTEFVRFDGLNSTAFQQSNTECRDRLAPGFCADSFPAAGRNFTISLDRKKFDWLPNPARNPDPVNKDLRVFVSARTYSGNRLAFKAPVFNIDTTTPSFGPASILLRPAYRQEEEANHPIGYVNATGIGAVANVTISVSDTPAHFNQSAGNLSTVRVYLWNRTGGDRNDPGNVGAGVNHANPPVANTPAPYAFVTAATGLKYVGSANKWQGNVSITARAGQSTPTTNFDLNLTLILTDPAGNQVMELLSNRYWEKPGAPFIKAPVLALPAPGFGRNGPYNLSVNVTVPTALRNDTDHAVDPGSVTVRVTNATGKFTAGDPAGWTKIGVKTFEKRLAKDAKGNYTLNGIPDADGNATIFYVVRASDTLGNQNSTANASFIVDKTPPNLVERGRLPYRGPATNVFAYDSVDTAANGSKASGPAAQAGFHWRVKGATGFWNTTMNLTGGTYRLPLKFNFTHRQVIEYYANATDRAGNPVTNGSATASRNFTVDLRPPVVTLDPPPATSADGRVTLSAVATDPDSGVAKVFFEGRAKGVSGAFGDWIPLGNTTGATFGPLCLGPGTSYEFRVYATDNAGNTANRSDAKGTAVTGSGCSETMRVQVKDPAGGSLLDAQGGSTHHTVKYSAATSATFGTGQFAKIRIDFSPDDGRHWFLLPGAAALTNTGTYDWTLNDPSCDRCLLRVTATLPGGRNATAQSLTFAIINGNPTTDFDGNGIYDECELRYFHGLSLVKGTDDSDGDGLSNQRECALGTDPTNSDTDGDGASDGVEVKLGHDPLNAADYPTQTELRFEEWGNYYLTLALVFVAVAALFLIGVARRW